MKIGLFVYLIVFAVFMPQNSTAESVPSALLETSSQVADCGVPARILRQFNDLSEQNQRLQQENLLIKQELGAAHELLLGIQQQVVELLAIQQQLQSVYPPHIK